MIDKDEAIRLLRKEVANKGAAYVYSRIPDDEINYHHGACVYFHHDQPSCIVGHALADAGFSAIDVSQQNGTGITHHFFTRFCDPEAQSVFNTAQIAQDGGESWGVALHAAERYYQRLGGTE